MPAFLLDAPTVPAGDKPTSQHPVARLGDYSDPRYGSFQITQADYSSWVRNMGALQNGRIPFDYDHAPDKGGSSEAAAWITGLDLASGKTLKAQDAEKWAGLDDQAQYALATIEWTPEGAQAVRDGRWLYVSPSIDDHYTDENDRDCGSALVGVALTNRPFLRQGMPTISLSAKADEAVAEATLLLHAGQFAEPQEGRDTPGDMPDLTKIAAALKLDTTADEDQILQAVKTLHTPPAPDLKTLAADSGMVLLSKDEHDTLKAAEGAKVELASRLDSIEAERADEKFTAAYTRTLSEGRIDATDETRDRFRKIFNLDPDLGVATLDALPKLVNTTPRGTGGGTREQAEVPAGVDEDAFLLNQAVEAHMAEHNETNYVKALDAVRAARKAI